MIFEGAIVHSDISMVDKSGENFKGANQRGNLPGGDLMGAIHRGANFQGAILLVPNSLQEGVVFLCTPELV